MMTDQNDPRLPVDSTEECAQRAGAKQTSLSEDAPRVTEEDPEHTETSEEDLDAAVEDTMDASDPPATVQP